MAGLDPNALVIRFATVLGGPYGAGSTNSNFVRVGFTGFDTDFTFASLLPGVGADTQIGGTAVAGPIPVGNAVGSDICDVAPLLMCGDPLGDPDCSDGECWGVEVDAEVEYQLKTGSGGNGNGGENGKGGGKGKGGGGGDEPGPDPSENDVSCSQGCFEPECLPSSEVDENGDPVDEGIGPGNFQVADIVGQGANGVRYALAGAEGICLSAGGTVETKPGNNVGPVIQGLSTRFGEYLGPMGGTAAQYPPDAVTTNRCTAGSGPDYWHADYLADSAGVPPSGTLRNRRVLTVPIVECDGSQNGQSTLDVLAYGCFFLTRNMPIQSGPDSYVYGQFIGECEASGSTGETPDPVVNNFFGPNEIVLYNDPAPES